MEVRVTYERKMAQHSVTIWFGLNFILPEKGLELYRSPHIQTTRAPSKHPALLSCARPSICGDTAHNQSNRQRPWRTVAYSQRDRRFHLHRMGYVAHLQCRPAVSACVHGARQDISRSDLKHALRRNRRETRDSALQGIQRVSHVALGGEYDGLQAGLVVADLLQGADLLQPQQDLRCSPQ